jgi:hypothetical protein
MQNEGDGIHRALARLGSIKGLGRTRLVAGRRKWESIALWQGALRGRRVSVLLVLGHGHGEEARNEDGAALRLLENTVGGVAAGQVGGQVGGSEGLGQVAPPAQTFSPAERGDGVRDGGARRRRVCRLGVEGHDVDLVRVAAVVHGQVAKHAVEADVGQVRRFLGARLRLGLRDLGVLVDVGHGRDGAAAGAYAREAGQRGRAGRRRLCDQRGATGMDAAQRRARGARSAGGQARPEGPRAGGGQRGRLGAGGGGLRVEQDRLGHGGRLILGDDDAAVARVLEVDLRQRPVMAAPGGQRRGVEGVRLAVGVVEGAGLGVEQVARVRLLRGRVEHGGGRIWVRRARRRARALAAAEELADHVWQRAHASMDRGRSQQASRGAQVSRARARRAAEQLMAAPEECGAGRAAVVGVGGDAVLDAVVVAVAVDDAVVAASWS